MQGPAQKKASLYAWISLQQLSDEMVISPNLLDFLEQALEPIPLSSNQAKSLNKSESCLGIIVLNLISIKVLYRCIVEICLNIYVNLGRKYTTTTDSRCFVYELYSMDTLQSWVISANKFFIWVP